VFGIWNHSPMAKLATQAGAVTGGGGEGGSGEAGDGVEGGEVSSEPPPQAQTAKAVSAATKVILGVRTIVRSDNLAVPTAADKGTCCRQSAST
jgi:hypothetical protein